MTLSPCPRCGGPLSASGECPRCLLALGLELPPRAPVGEAPPASAPPRRPEPPPLEEIARRFPQLEVLGLLGQGGMGVVYRARQSRLGREVALKVLPPELSADPAFAERFLREARAMARLSHPHIVAVHDFGETEGLCWLLMEFVDGVNLRQALRAGMLTPDKALAVVPQMCAALQYAHDEGVVHRDIKPENVLLDRQGRVKIADFGLAKLVGPQDVTLTGEAQVFGTPHYMAPEQLEAARDVDHRADIFSLGVVFYEMLTGRLPLGRFEPPSARVRVDVRLDEIVLHALEHEPARRYQHAAEVKTDLESVAGGGDPQAARASAPAAPAAAPAADARADVEEEDDGPDPVGIALVAAMLLGGGGSLWVTVERRLYRAPDEAWTWCSLGLAALAGLAVAAARRRRALSIGACATLLVGGTALLDLALMGLGLGGDPVLFRGVAAWRVTLLLGTGLAAVAVGVAHLRRAGQRDLLAREASWATGAAAGALLLGLPFALGLAAHWLSAADALHFSGAGQLLVAQGALLLLARGARRRHAPPAPAAAAPALRVEQGHGTLVLTADVARGLAGWWQRVGDGPLMKWLVLAAVLVMYAACWTWAGRLLRYGTTGVVAGLLLLLAASWQWACILVLMAPELHAALRAESAGRRVLRRTLAAALLVAGLGLLGAGLLSRWERGTLLYLPPEPASAQAAAGGAGEVALLAEATGLQPAVAASLERRAATPQVFGLPGPASPEWAVLLAPVLLAAAFAAATRVPRLAGGWRAGWAPVLLGPGFLLGGLFLAGARVELLREAESLPPLQPVSGLSRLPLGIDEARDELLSALDAQGYAAWLQQPADWVAPADGGIVACEWLLAAAPRDPQRAFTLADVGPRRREPRLVLRLCAAQGARECVLAWDAGRVREWGAETAEWPRLVERILEPLRRL